MKSLESIGLLAFTVELGSFGRGCPPVGIVVGFALLLHGPDLVEMIPDLVPPDEGQVGEVGWTHLALDPGLKDQTPVLLVGVLHKLVVVDEGLAAEVAGGVAQSLAGTFLKNRGTCPCCS